METSSTRAYPVHWEADVVLRDGGIAHIRPITPEDAERLVAFYEQVSDESKYYRFFAPYPRLSDRDVHRFTHHDYVDRVGLAATVGGEFIATVRYDRLGPTGAGREGADLSGPAEPEGARAEVAFLVQDAHQGRGVASALLEHIAAVARERGIRRFDAEVLPANRKMIKVFTDAGYTQQRSFSEGVVRLELDLEPTEASVAVMRAREQRAEARSVQRLLAPRSVAVVGAGRRESGVGRTVLRHVLAAGFTGRVYAVNHHFPPEPGTLQPEGVHAYRSVSAIEEPVDLAVLAVPAAAVPDAVADCGAHGVPGVLVIAGGYAESGPEGRERQRALVRQARSYGMRVIGPNAFGVVNTSSAVRLNATLSPEMPAAGRLGLFTQSGAIGIALLSGLHRRGPGHDHPAPEPVPDGGPERRPAGPQAPAGGDRATWPPHGYGGISTFVSAGNRADVSGNDLLQYWHDDPDTDVVLMYLESIGNPRKFTRLARRTAAAKPVVVVKGARHSGSLPPGHTVATSAVPDSTVSALFRQAGVIRVDTVTELLDVGLLLAHQPLPAGGRVAVLGNSESLGLLAYDVSLSEGLRPRTPIDLTTAASPDDFRAALGEALEDTTVQAVVVTAIPRVGGVDDREPDSGDDPALAAALLSAAAGSGKPVVVVHLALDRFAERLAAGLDQAPQGAPSGAVCIPAYPSAERAVRSLAEAVRYARWRRRSATPGRVPELDGIDEAAARDDVARLLDAAATSPLQLDDAEVRTVLGRYGVEVRRALPAPDADCAARAARLLGYPVALKATARHLRHRADLGSVRLDVADEEGLRRAYQDITGRLGTPEQVQPVVQSMAPRGVDTVVRAAVDPAVGSVLSFGLSGAPSELLGDLAHRLVPATDRDAADLVRSIRAAPMLFGWRGAEPVDTAALEELLLRVSRLVDDVPEVVEIHLEPVVVAKRGLAVLGASVRLAHPPARTDLGPRALSSL